MSEAPDLSRTFGLLLADISRLLRRDFARRAQHIGLTQGQWRALAYLAANEGLTQAALAEILEIQPISLARVLDRMVASGWIERRPCPTDRRAYQLYLTKACEPVMQQLREIGAASRELALAGLDDEQREQLIDLLVVLKGNLQNAAAPGVEAFATESETSSDVAV